MIEWLREHAPVLFSPVFYGLIFGALFSILAHYQVADEFLLQTISKLILAITGVRIVWRGAEKVSGE